MVLGTCSVANLELDVTTFPQEPLPPFVFGCQVQVEQHLVCKMEAPPLSEQRIN